ncbi:MAG: type I-C CRISPR-associated protein Cas8c/Csd1 [Acidobacteria bacterium]|nr:type I-C CRISPR-associated protein Cas8c/Csd1 [Acidobacteriota bacterium]
MILRSLRDLAVREGLLKEGAYQPKAVAWVITVGREGRFLGLTATVGEEDARGRRRPKTMHIPRRKGRTSKAEADFLVDKSEYVLGIEPAAKRKAEDLKARRLLFLQEVRKAAEATGEAALGAVARFLEEDGERERCEAEVEREGYKGNDLFAFEYEGRLVHELAGIRAYYAGEWQGGGEGEAQCVVCGRTGPGVDKHPGVKAPGGSTSGVALVSFNAEAFESYGWKRNENAPVCRECADGYTTGLSRLLSDRWPDPINKGQVLARRYVRLSPDTTAVYWAEEESAAVDLFAELFEAAGPEAVKALLTAPWAGRAPAGGAARFYCLILSGAEGRAVLRGMHRGTVEEVEGNVREYFQGMDGSGEAPLPLKRLLRSLAVQGKWKNIPPGLSGEVFLAILFRRRFPREVLSAAVARCRAERRVSRERAAMLRAHLAREKGWEVNVSLDKDDKRAGYRLGRLLAVLERLQADAQGNPNKTIVDRYYGAASTRPVVVFPALVRLAQHHAAKLRSAGYYQARLGEIVEGLSEFPATLTLEEQGLFALGYYHQRQDLYRKKPEAAQGEAAPEAAEETGEAA